MLRRGGTAVVIGVLPDGQDVTIPGNSFILEKRLVGCIMGSNRFRIDVPEYLALYQQGRLDLDSMISRRIGLDEIGEGYAALERGETARSVVVFN
jgi:S-(hydroxymethyl)glutathione dehydrogenase/alcohol dehydrogenase